MKEYMSRQFFTESDEEANDIDNIRKLIEKMDGCILAHIVGTGSYCYIEATFTKKIILDELGRPNEY